LKRLKGSYATLFRSLGKIKNWTEEEDKLLAACFNYVVSAADRSLSFEEAEALQQSVDNQEASERMQTFFDILEEKWKNEGMRRGEIRGKIKGKIETIQSVASVRFQESPIRLNQLLTKFNDLDLLEQTRQFTFVAPSLPDLENFAENLLQNKPKARRVTRKKTL